MQIVELLALMNRRGYDTGGWAIFCECTEDALGFKDKSDKLITWQSTMVMRLIEQLCGYSV